MVHAEHSSEHAWKNPQNGKEEVHVGGEPGGFIIELENGFKIWHMGDTGVFGDMKLIAQMYKPDLVLMPIGGGPFVMGPADAAFATQELIQPKTVIPMHYGTTPQLPGTPEEYQQALLFWHSSAGASARRDGNLLIAVICIRENKDLESTVVLTSERKSPSILA
jgi:L-ascorbate metabolism protein UlaG (beta-lactamase superfamily)